MQLTFSLDFQEQLLKVEQFRQSKGSCLPTSQLLSVLIATPTKHSGNKIEILTILQRKSMPRKFKQDFFFNKLLY